MPVVLVANDETKVEFSNEEIKYVKMATDVLEDETEGEVPATNVNGNVLNLAKHFLGLRVAGPMGTLKKPVREKSLEKSGLNKPFAEWMDSLPIDDVFDLLKGADYLKIDDLVDLCAARIAKDYLKWDNAEKDAIFLGGESFQGSKEALARDHALREKYQWADKEPEYEEEILKAANDALKGAAAAAAGGGGAAAE